MNSAVLNVTNVSLIWRLWKCCSNECCWVSEIIIDVMSEKADKVNNKDVWDIEVKTLSETEEITEMTETTENFFLLLICKLVIFSYTLISSLTKQLWTCRTLLNSESQTQ